MKGKQIFSIFAVAVGAAILKAFWEPTPSPWLTLLVWIVAIAGIVGWFISCVVKGYRSDKKDNSN
mgnify:CR=1 FL=1